MRIGLLALVATGRNRSVEPLIYAQLSEEGGRGDLSALPLIGLLALAATGMRKKTR